MAPVKHCVIGRHGLIGSAITKKLGEVSSFPTSDTETIFHFGSYSHQVFERNPTYFMKQMLEGYTTLLEICAAAGMSFVYPSSALVLEKDTPFARFKKTIESLAACYEARSIGLRIFPVYGPGESRSVISQWCRSMKNGVRPIVFGDGNQSRDFIYADDAASQIVAVASAYGGIHARIACVGTGTRTSFNMIIEIINGVLGSHLDPIYVVAPAGYSEGIACEDPLPARVSIEQGIRNILDAS